MKKQDIEEQNQFEQLIQGLIDNKFGVCDNFLPSSTILGLRDKMILLDVAGKMKTAGIGNKLIFQKNELFRTDKLNWIDAESTNENELVYLEKITRFIHYLNQTCFTALKTFESHYSIYEVGSFYKKHLDQFKSEKGRKFSIVLYLNQDWKEEDKGHITLYPENKEQINISPIGGRLVFFRSDEMEHEVNPSPTRERRSIAGWLKM